jgi:hypothetical protein
VNFLQNIRLRDAEQIIVAFEIRGPVLEPITAIVGFLQLVCLDHGTHSTIKRQNAPAQFGFKAGFAKACGASIPEWFHSIFNGLDENPKLRELVAVTVASELTLQLKNEGVKDFHIYTLNKWESTEAICNILGVPQMRGQRAA